MSHLHSPYQQLLSSGYTGASAALAEAMDVVYQQADKSEPVLSSYVSGYTTPNDYAYSGGVYSPKQDKLWFIPHQNSVSPVWHYVDCRTQKVVAYTHGTSGLHATGAAYVGGSWDPDTDRIYMHPVEQTTTLHYIDCASGAVVAYKGFSGLPVRYAQGGGAYDPINRRIWLSPAVGSTGTHWPYIDTKTATTGWYPHGTTGLCGASSLAYHGAVYSPASRKVFFIPCLQVRSDFYHYIDCDALEVRTYRSSALAGSTGYSFAGGVYDAHNDRVYMTPCNAKGDYLYIDCRNNEVVSYAGASGAVCCEYAFGGCYSPLTRRIYLSYRSAPAYGATGMWSYIDTETNKLVAYKGISPPAISSCSPGTFVPSLNRVYFTPYDIPAGASWCYVQESAPKTHSMLPYALATTPARGPSLVCIDEAEVSMLCVDGSDGKGGVFQLRARFSDGLYHNEWCAWSSSDPSIATVSPSGLVTAVSTGYDLPLGAVVTLRAVYNGEEVAAAVTVYLSVPDPTTRFLLPGGCGEGLTGSSVEQVCLFSAEQGAESDHLKYHRVVSRYNWVSSAGYLVTSGANKPGASYLIEYEEDKAAKRVFNAGSLSYTDYSFGPSITGATGTPFDAVVSSDGCYLGGVGYTPTVRGTETFNKVDEAYLLFQKNLIKSVMWNAGSTGSYASITNSSSRMELMACPQNYVRTSDLTGHINKTRILNMGTMGSSYDMTSTFVPGAWFGSYNGDKLCIDEAEVSMLCVDGSDGKGGVFQLHLGTGGGISYNHAASWSSSDPSVATVSSSGLVTAVSNGGAPLGKDVTITASYGGAAYSCLVTVYETMPSADVEGEGLWRCKGGAGYGLGSAYAATVVFAGQVPPGGFPSSRLISSYVVPPDGAYAQHLKNGVSSSYINPSYGASDAYYSPLLVVMAGTTEYQYKTAYPQVLGSAYSTDISYDSSTVRVNGAPVDKTLVQTKTRSVGFFDQDWHQATRKVVLSAYASVAEVPSFASAIVLVPQNYIRYSNRTTPNGTVRASYTVIPNIGTLGSDYALTANNVPAVWFGV